MKYVAKLSIASVAVAAAAFACSLIERPSDYFDPTHKLVTLASLPNATHLVLTTDYVFVRDNDGLERVLKSGGPAIRAYPSNSIDLLATDGLHRVVWHDRDGIHILDDEQPLDASMLVSDANAASIGVSANEIAYSVSPSDPEAGAGLSIVSDAGTVSDVSDSPKIAIGTSAGSLYFGFAGVLDRELRDGEPAFKNNTLMTCDIALWSDRQFAPDDVQAELDASSFRAIVVSTGRVHTITQDTCCKADAQACPKLDPTIFPVESHTVALRNGQVFWATDGKIVSFDFERLAQGSIPAEQTTLYEGVYDAKYIAVDDQHVFFIAHDLVQRLAIGDAEN